MKKHWDRFLTEGITWLFRRRSPVLPYFTGGIRCLITAAVGFVGLSIYTKLQYGNWSLTFSIQDGTDPVTFFVILLTGVGTVLALGAPIAEIIFQRAERRRIMRKLVVVVEVVGLRDGPKKPLLDALPERLEGVRESLLVDLRQRIQDNVVTVPEKAVNEMVATLPRELNRRVDGRDRSDVTVVFGGLAATPLLFLAGTRLDDEGAIEVMDWDRHEKVWRDLADSDDGRRFTVTGLDAVRPDTTDVAMAVSGSYAVNQDALLRRTGNMPLVHFDLDGRGSSTHWSLEKQRQLGRQFFEAMRALVDLGVARVHLAVATPASLAFRLGMLCDHRLFPEIIIYEFAGAGANKFTWAVRLPAGPEAQPKFLEEPVSTTKEDKEEAL